MPRLTAILYLSLHSSRFQHVQCNVRLTHCHSRCSWLKKPNITNATSQQEYHPKLVSAPPEYPSLRCMKRICAARTLLRRQIFSNEHSIYRHCDYYLKDATFLPGDLVNSRAKQTLMIQSKTTHATYHWMSKNTKINTKSDIHWIQCNTSFCSYIYLNSAATFQVYKVYMCVTCYDTKFT